MKKYFATYKSILHLAIPVMLSQLGQVTVQVADNVMVGRLGASELASVSFANGVFVILMLFGIGVCMGLTPLIGKAFLQKNNSKLASLLKNGFFLYTSIGVIITIVLYGTSFFLDNMGQEDIVAEMARPYFLVLVASIMPLMIFSSFKQFLEGIGNTRISTIITVSANALNILLNYLLIYGKFGFPEMGMLGAGTATLISRILMPVALWGYLRYSAAFKHYLKEAQRALIDKQTLKELLRIGVPIGIQITFEILIFSLSGIMMGWIGKEELAAHQATNVMTTITYMISLGIGSAATIRVSHSLSAGKFDELRRLVRATVHLTAGLMSAMGIVFICFRHELPLLIIKESIPASIATQLLIVASIFQLFDGIQVALLACLRGIADVTVPMIIAFISYIIIGMPACYIFAFTLNIGPTGIWLGLLTGLMFAAVLFAIRIRSQFRSLEKNKLAPVNK